MISKTKTAVAAALLGLLTACGGGGDGDAPAVNANAEGFWEGTTGAGDPLGLVVTGEGTLWSFQASRSAGLVVQQGAGSTQGKNYAANGKVYQSIRLAGAFTLNATVEEKKTLQGSVSGAQEFSFKLDYDASYDRKASMGDIQGTWRLVESDSTMSTTIAGSGALTGYLTDGTSRRCDFSGTVTPHSSKNYFLAAVKFANSCAPGYAGVSISGIALADPAEGDDPATMLAFMVPADGSFMFPLAGRRTSGG